MNFIAGIVIGILVATVGVGTLTEWSLKTVQSFKTDVIAKGVNK